MTSEFNLKEFKFIKLIDDPHKGFLKDLYLSNNSKLSIYMNIVDELRSIFAIKNPKPKDITRKLKQESELASGFFSSSPKTVKKNLLDKKYQDTFFENALLCQNILHRDLKEIELIIKEISKNIENKQKKLEIEKNSRLQSGKCSGGYYGEGINPITEPEHIYKYVWTYFNLNRYIDPITAQPLVIECNALDGIQSHEPFSAIAFLYLELALRCDDDRLESVYISLCYQSLQQAKMTINFIQGFYLAKCSAILESSMKGAINKKKVNKHKLSKDEKMKLFQDWANEYLKAEPSLTKKQIAQKIAEQFKATYRTDLSPNSIYTNYVLKFNKLY